MSPNSEHFYENEVYNFIGHTRQYNVIRQPSRRLILLLLKRNKICFTAIKIFKKSDTRHIFSV